MLWGLYRVIMIMNANIASLMTYNILKKFTPLKFAHIIRLVISFSRTGLSFFSFLFPQKISARAVLVISILFDTF